MSENDLREYSPEQSTEAPQAAPPKSALQPSYEEAQKAVSGLALSLAQVREIYVGKGYPKFEKAFAKCDERGGSAHSFSIAPFFFSFFWFFYRKMYAEGAIVAAIAFGVGYLAETFLKSGSRGVAGGIGIAVAMNAKSLYWRAVDKKIARAMQMFPDSPESAIGWLRAKGGVNYWAVAAGALFFGLVLLGIFYA